MLQVVGYITSVQLVLVHFVSWRILVQPKDLNLFKSDLNLFFTATKIHTTVCIVKKQNNFTFSSLVIQICQMCFPSTVAYGIIIQVSLFNLYQNLPCTMVVSDCAIISFISFYAIIQFQIKKKHYSNSPLISNNDNIRFLINLYFDVLTLLLDLQDSLNIRTNLWHFKKT